MRWKWLFLGLLFLSCTDMQKAPPVPLITNGVLDLRSLSFAENPSLTLEGDARFFWNEFVSPDSAGVFADTSQVFITLPGAWSSSVKDSIVRPGTGYVTLAFSVLLPAQRPERLGLQLRDTETSYRLFVNGAQIMAAGSPGTSRETTTPAWKPQIGEISTASDTLRIVIHVANFHHFNGGIRENILFGDLEALERYQKQNMAIKVFFFGSLLMIGFFHLLMFSIQVKNLSALFFSLFSMVMAVRFLVIEDFFLISLIPSISWPVLIRITYLTFSLATTFFMAYTYYVFPNRVGKIGGSLLSIYGLMYSGVVVFAEPLFFTRLLPAFEILILLSAVFVSIVPLTAFKENKTIAGLFLASCVGFGACVINDVLHNLEFIQTTYVTSWGVFGFVILQSYLLFGRYKQAFVRIEELSVEKDRAEKASRAKTDFLANMSHEIRTPLNSIIGFSELLKATELNRFQRQSVDSIVASGKNLLAIINDILDFSKIESGKLEIDLEDVRLYDTLYNVMDVVRFSAGKKSIEFLTDFDPSLPEKIYADETRLRQVLVNLLDNGIKFTDRGYVLFSVSLAAEDRIRFSIKDSGIGISPDQRSKLFKAFSQADASTIKKFGGTGLGLVIAYQIVQQMGGTLDFVSAIGSGSEFFFELPLLRTYSREPQPESDEAPQKSILVVDDHELARTLTASMIRRLGYAVDLADSAKQAIIKIHKNRNYNAVLIDYGMPVQNGFDLTAVIRNEFMLTKEHVPVYLLLRSSEEQEADKHPLRSLINAVLPKPVKITDLKATLAADPPVEQHPVKRTVPEQQQAGSFRRFNVLIVDDNEANLKLATLMVQQIRKDIVTIEARSGIEALSKIAEAYTDLVLMDVQMPEMDGCETVVRLRQSENGTSHIPVVAVTAGATTHERDRCFASGMDDYLTKPVDATKLRMVLERFLGIPAAGENADFNRAELERRLEFNQDIFKALFPVALSRNIAALKTAIETANEPQVRYELHKLIGVSKSMSFNRIAELTESLQKTGAFTADSTTLLTEIERSLERLKNNGLAT